jgi:SAM-dependent methyltransferase
MDLTKSAMAYGRGEARRFRIPVNFVVGSVLEPPFSDSTFDTVYLGQVIEHIEDDKAVVQEAVRILRPGGKLVISVLIGHGCMPPEGIEGGHVNFYDTEEDCAALLSEQPLEDVQFHAGDNGRYIFSARSRKRA